MNIKLLLVYSVCTLPRSGDRFKWIPGRAAARAMPTGGTGTLLGVLAQILPQIEQDNVPKPIDWSKQPSDPANGTPRNTILSGLRCPGKGAKTVNYIVGTDIKLTVGTPTAPKSGRGACGFKA